MSTLAPTRKIDRILKVWLGALLIHGWRRVNMILNQFRTVLSSIGPANPVCFDIFLKKKLYFFRKGLVFTALVLLILERKKNALDNG